MDAIKDDTREDLLRRIAQLERALAESRNNDRIAMSWLNELRDVFGNQLTYPEAIAEAKRLKGPLWYCECCDEPFYEENGLVNDFNTQCDNCLDKARDE